LNSRKSDVDVSKVVGVAALALLCFVACFPVLGGAVVPRGWGVVIKRLFPGIYF